MNQRRMPMTREQAEPLVKSRGPMDGQELHACIDLIGWPARSCADTLAVDEGTFRQWGRDSRPVPDPVAGWLRRLAKAHIANPPPPPPTRGRASPDSPAAA